ncbi:MAG: hypothetical protein Kow0067_09880 [Coriobacteriia bacterium]
MATAPEDRVHILEERFGVAFADPSLARMALTHPSFAAERPDAAGYERLEFLGDSVLGFIVADHLYRSHPDEPEGVLTRLKIAAVAGETLAEVADELGIGDLVWLGRGAARGEGRSRRSLLENVFEAIIGAIYLDQGLDVARHVVIDVLGARLLDPSGAPQDPKSALQELTQASDGVLPAYRTTAVEGPPHDRRFTVEVTVDGRVVGLGTGRSKKDAEKAAASAALARLEEGS